MKRILAILAVGALLLAQVSTFPPTGGGVGGTIDASQIVSGNIAKARQNNQTVYADQNITYSINSDQDMRSGNLRVPSGLFSAIPTASLYSGGYYVITDGNGVNCTAGGGSTATACFSNGTSWVLISGTNATANPTVTFTSQTSVTFTHNLSTDTPIIQCYDASGSRLWIEPSQITSTSTSVSTITFTSSQSGKCVANATGGGGGGAGGDAVAGASNLATPGGIPFVSAAGILNIDATKLFWNNTTKRLGIGTASPLVELDVSGSGHFNSGFYIGGGSGNASLGYYDSALRLASTWPIRWSGTTAANTTPDVGISRVSPGVARIDDGGTAVRDLQLRRIQLGTASGASCDSSGRFTIEATAGGTGVADTAKICLKDASDTYSMVSIGGSSGGSGTPGGSSGQIQYNSGGSFAGATVGNGLTLSGGTLSVDVATVPEFLTASATLNFGVIATATCGEQTITLTGAASQDGIFLGPPSDLDAGLTATAYISATNVATVRLCKITSGSTASINKNFRVTVVRGR